MAGTSKKGENPPSKPLTDARVKRSLSAVDRSPQALAMDSKKIARVIFPSNPTKEQMALYLKYPNRYDIEGVDAPIGSATVSNGVPRNKGETVAIKRKPNVRGKMEYSGSRYRGLDIENDPMGAARMMADDLAIENMESTEDMLAYLKDIRYDEIAPDNRWKYDPRATAKAYREVMRSNNAMFDPIPSYRKTGKKRSRT